MNFSFIYIFEILEYISNLLVLIGLIIFFIFGKISILICFIFTSLFLNLINRFRLEQRTRNRLGAGLKIQLRKFNTELNEIKAQINNEADKYPRLKSSNLSADNPLLCDQTVMDYLQQDLDTLDQSVTSIIDYINKYVLHKRIKYLEDKCRDISEQIEQIYPQKEATDNVNISSPNLDLTSYSSYVPPDINWKCIHVIQGHKQSVTGLSISFDQKYLASVSWDQDLKVWSLENASLIDTVLASEQGLLTVAINQLSLESLHLPPYILATGSLDQKIKIWSLVKDRTNQLTLNLEDTITGHSGSIHGLAIASQAKILISGSYDQTVKQWDLETRRMIESSYAELGSIYAIALHEPEKMIVSAGGDGTVTIWELATGRMLCSLVGNIVSVESLAISPSAEIVAAGCIDGTIKLWYVSKTLFSKKSCTINPHLVMEGHEAQVMSLQFSPDEEILYSGAADGHIKIWYLPTAKELGHLNIDENNRVFALALSCDGSTLVAGGVDGTIKVWQQQT
jgi:WD40 repeat protein